VVIIIINCHYSPLWVFAFSTKSFQVLLSIAASFQFLTFSFFRSSVTSSCHRCLGFSTGLLPIGFQSSSFLVGLAWTIFWICPSHLILCALMNVTIVDSDVFVNWRLRFLGCDTVHMYFCCLAPNVRWWFLPQSLRFSYLECGSRMIPINSRLFVYIFSTSSLFIWTSNIFRAIGLL